MYRINQDSNTIQKIEETTFKEIGASERNHLQEWIAKNPEVLCADDENLLIIQKEFAGFDDTRERLDLLALDLDGNLVIIENKLDDSGRDVTWQGLKYVSYCSSLTTDQIIRIYDEYLEHSSETAEDNIRKFLDLEDDQGLVLNESDQRLILIAHKFRKEVTSTVMWLLEKEVKIECYKAIPFKMDQTYFLQIEKIIPLPETEDHLIGLKEKKKENRKTSIVNSIRQGYVIDFWNEFKASFSNDGFDKFDSIKAGKGYYIRFGAGKGHYACCFGRDGLRIELVFLKDYDKTLINKLEVYRNEIDSSFSKPLIWEKPQEGSFSKIQYTYPYKTLKADFLQKNGRKLRKWRDGEDYEPRIKIFKKFMIELYEVTSPYIEKAGI